MKKYGLSILINFLIIAGIDGKIINGYEPDIATAREGLKKLTTLLTTDKTLSFKETKFLQQNIRHHRDFIIYHELTERLLQQFKMISLEIYNAIDSITDANATSVDVYVKFVARDKMIGSVAGTTNIPLQESGDAYRSRYGLNTISVQIVTGKNALILLAHEFGHVHHQVPNLRAYQSFYIKLYQNTVPESQEAGHHHTDASGQEASAFQKRFYTKYTAFLKIKTNKNENPLELLDDISKLAALTY
jgi:hypothetical protein